MDSQINATLFSKKQKAFANKNYIGSNQNEQTNNALTVIVFSS